MQRHHHIQKINSEVEVAVDRVAAQMKRQMEFHGLSIPLSVNVSVGRKWGELEVWRGVST